MSSCPVNIVASWNCLAIGRSPLILDYGQRPRGQPRKQIVKVDAVEEKAQLLIIHWKTCLARTEW